MERLLCVKIASRGDLLLSAPAFKKLREKRVGWSMELLVGSSCLDVAQHLPFFDKMIPLDDSKLLAGRMREKWEATKCFLKLLKGEGRSQDHGSVYSEVYLFHRDWRYGVFAWLAGIPVRKGFENWLGSSFLTHSYLPKPNEHHVSQYMGMTGYPRQEENMKGVWSFLEWEKEQGVELSKAWGFQMDHPKTIALGFGGGRNVKTVTPLKSWPIEFYLQLAAELETAGWQVVWVGDKHDLKKLPENCGGVNLAGELTVPQTAAVLSLCQWVVANDSLVLHLAESLGIPSIGIFGPTDPFHYRPLGDRSGYLWKGDRLPCSPCHRDGFFPVCQYQHQCMTSITVEMVLEKINPLK